MTQPKPPSEAQKPVSPVEEPSEARLLKSAIEAGIAKVHTSLPGIVTAYDPLTKTATVQPAAHNGKAFEPLPGVPILPYTGGGFMVFLPCIPGDEVELHFQEADPARFIKTGKPGQADYVRPHGLYATAVPTAISDLKRALLNAPPGAAMIGTIDGSVAIAVTPTGVALGSPTATDFVALASRVDAALAAIKVWLDAHVHQTAGTGPPVAPSPVSPPSGSLTVRTTP